MGMVCSTYIAKGKLTALKEIDSGSFGKIFSTTYDGVPGVLPCLPILLPTVPGLLRQPSYIRDFS